MAWGGCRKFPFMNYFLAFKRRLSSSYDAINIAQEKLSPSQTWHNVDRVKPNSKHRFSSIHCRFLNKSDKCPKQNACVYLAIKTLFFILGVETMINCALYRWKILQKCYCPSHINETTWTCYNENLPKSRINVRNFLHGSLLESQTWLDQVSIWVH